MTTNKRERKTFTSLPLELRQQVYRNVLVKSVEIVLGGPAWHQCIGYCHIISIILRQKRWHNEAWSIFLGENILGYSIRRPNGCPTGFGRHWPWSAIKHFRLNFFTNIPDKSSCGLEITMSTAIQHMLGPGFQPKQFELRLHMDTLHNHYSTLERELLPHNYMVHNFYFPWGNKDGVSLERGDLVLKLQGLRAQVQQRFTICLYGKIKHFKGVPKMSDFHAFSDMRTIVGQGKEWTTEEVRNGRGNYKTVSWSLDCTHLDDKKN